MMSRKEHAEVRKQVAELLGCNPKYVSVRLERGALVVEAPYAAEHLHVKQVSAVHNVLRGAREKVKAA